MANFVYNLVVSRPNVGVQWFEHAYPSEFNTIVNVVKSAPGYISGSWTQDPNNPNRYLVTHSWTDKASWQAMADTLRTIPANQLRMVYFASNGIGQNITLSE